MDFGTIGALLTSVKAATDIASYFKDSGLSLEKAEAKMKAAELISALADVKLEAAQIQERILEKDERIRELESEAKVRRDLRFGEICYFMSNSEGIDEPYCQPCFDSTKKLMRLHSDNNGLYTCRVCASVFKTLTRVTSDQERLASANIERINRIKQQGFNVIGY